MRWSSDICKCANHECPMREECFRYTCIGETVGQLYALFAPVDGKCDYFVKNKEI